MFSKKNLGQVVVGLNTPERWQSKTLILSTNEDQKYLETDFSIAICRHSSDKWQSKTLFLMIFDPHSSIVKRVLDCRLSDMLKLLVFTYSHTIRCITPLI